MWWLIPIIGLLLGVYFGGFFNIAIPAGMVKYLSIGILASLDSVFGGVRALYEKDFDNLLMLTGFFTNALLAAGLTYIGDMLGIDLYYAAIFAFGVRLFSNLSMIRVHILRNLRERERIFREYNREREAEGDEDFGNERAERDLSPYSVTRNEDFNDEYEAASGGASEEDSYGESREEPYAEPYKEPYAEPSAESRADYAPGISGEESLAADDDYVRIYDKEKDRKG